MSKIIGTKSIKKQLLELYNTFSKRIAILYHYDRNLKVSSSTNSYLARANYELLIQGYEKIIGIAFGPYKKALESLNRTDYNVEEISCFVVPYNLCANINYTVSKMQGGVNGWQRPIYSC